MSTGNCLALRVAIRLSLPFLSGMYAHVCPNLEANGGDVQLGVLFLSIQFSHSLIYSQRADPLIQTERPQTPAILSTKLAGIFHASPGVSESKVNPPILRCLIKINRLRLDNLQTGSL